MGLACNLLSVDAGKKAGYLGSIYFAGSFAGSLLWGCLADRWGRRPVILLGICGSIFSEILFGFRLVILVDNLLQLYICRPDQPIHLCLCAVRISVGH